MLYATHIMYDTWYYVDYVHTYLVRTGTRIDHRIVPSKGTGETRSEKGMEGAPRSSPALCAM